LQLKYDYQHLQLFIKFLHVQSCGAGFITISVV